MKYLVVFSALFLILGCGNSRETAQELKALEEMEARKEREKETHTDETAGNSRVVGIVHISETECPIYIETKLESSTVNMYPMNLEEKYKRDGMRLKFNYELSRGAQPENCDVDMVVSMSDVTLMR